MKYGILESMDPMPQAPQQNPYGFILDTQHAPKKSITGGSGSFRSKLLLIIGAALVLIIGIIVVSQLLNSKKAANAKNLTNLVIEQQEIIRVSDLGVKGASDPTVAALAESTKLVITSQQVGLLKYLSSKGVKVPVVQLNAKTDKGTDKTLTNATVSNRFDEAYKTIHKNSLINYSTDLKVAYDTASNPTSKQLLSDYYKSVQNLLK